MNGVFAVIAVLISPISHSDEYHDTKVVQIQAGYSNGAVYMKVEGTPLNPGGCSKSNFYGIDPSSHDVSSALSLLLSAKATNAAVSLRLSSTECFTNYPKVITTILK